ncbi:hypothetical protein D030_4277A, partial [Vibrio parahaemolyticus AQ3810]
MMKNKMRTLCLV